MNAGSKKRVSVKNALKLARYGMRVVPTTTQRQMDERMLRAFNGIATDTDIGAYLADLALAVDRRKQGERAS